MKGLLQGFDDGTKIRVFRKWGKIATEDQKQEITMEEIKEALFKMKNGRVPWMANVNIEL